MKFEIPLLKGQLIKRYKRFLADVELESGELVTAHCANPGSMQGISDVGSTVYLSRNTNPKAKLGFRWEMIDTGDSLVGINTARPNAVVEEAISAGQIDELQGYASMRREVKYGTNSRIDILLEGPESCSAPHTCFVEVKNVTYRVGNGALFPDSVTTRGEKHLRELMEEVRKGNRAVMFYLVNRNDCDYLAPAFDIDPVYAQRMIEAYENGVELVAYMCDLSVAGISVSRKLPIKLK